ncbi:hypothetical protein AB0F72_38260 [Actinoplanes sp. NPDC023936]|uniref:hypothetical protein n=1 Tax=Actinoplanes sp. NPDC023936 TaxID=3154910 RepID=UPI0033D8A7BC
MTVHSSQAPAAARRVVSALLWVALAVIVVIAAGDVWAALSSGDPVMAMVAVVAGLAPILLAVLVRRNV